MKQKIKIRPRRSHGVEMGKKNRKIGSKKKKNSAMERKGNGKYCSYENVPKHQNGIKKSLERRIAMLSIPFHSPSS